MSVSRPARCVLSSASSIAKARPMVQCRDFSTTQSLPARRRPRFASVKAEDMGLVSQTPTNQVLKSYTKKDEQNLSKRYTPDQMRVIAAGEEAIDLEDIRSHGVVRNDPYAFKYLDDFSVLRPTLDKIPKPASTVPKGARWLNETERFDQVNEWLGKMTEERELQGLAEPLTRLDVQKFIDETPSMTGGGKFGSDVLVPALPKIKSMEGMYQNSTLVDVRDPTGTYDKLRRQTGMSLEDILDLNVKNIVAHRVVNMTRLGRIQSFYTLSIAGNGKGMLGLGEGKSAEMVDSLNQSRMAAIKNMKPVPRYEDRTIFGDIEAKVSAVRVQLMSRPPGFGLRCQYLIFEMCRAAGITDIAARVPYARNKMNTAKATYQALMNQRIPDEVARGLGKKLVDVRKVYYGG
ncbi:28S ribosomal protein S5, mitochondrial [Pseudogymnoascus australis]